MYFIGEMG